jgi:hypothetical protein
MIFATRPRTSRELREQMLEMAGEYDLLAESVERQRGPT